MYKKYIPYLISIIALAIVSLAYFSPVLEGKKLYQSDIVQFKGMSKQIVDYRKQYGEEPYWTDAAFSGMPAYAVSAYYPHDYIKKLDKVIRFLPAPADFLFLYFAGFFLLILTLFEDWKIALLGALGFGLSTYLIIIIGVGHNSKAHAIGYFPWVFAGVILLFKRKYFTGFVLTTIAAGLEIATGHIQMAYYLFLMLLVYVIYSFVQSIKAKNIRGFLLDIGLLAVSGILAVAMNANRLLPTREYAAESTRSAGELHYTPDGKKRTASSGLSYDYITEYSYGLLETFNLFIPRLTGGSNAENIGKDSRTYRFLRDKIGASQARSFVQSAPMYWGDQPIVAAPAYIGAVMIFLMVFALFIPGIKEKNWAVAGIVLALLLSWGKNFPVITDFFIRYVPLYNKFRAVSSIQVIIELLTPLLAVAGLYHLFSNEKENLHIYRKAWLRSLYITGGIALFFLLLGPSWFTFESPRDANYDQMLKGLSSVLRADRIRLLRADSLRSLLFVLGTGAGIGLYLYRKINRNILVGFLAVLVLFDLAGVDKRYVNKDDFVPASTMDKPFKMSNIDKEILKDKTRYRVGNFTTDPLNDGTTSYYHLSIGGYHAAKPRRYQELFDYQVNKNNFEVINMLNTKYILFPGEKGAAQLQKNPDIYGNAWFATHIKRVHNADEEIKALDSLTADLAVVNEKFHPVIPKECQEKDTTAYIRLITEKTGDLTYESFSGLDRLALFSEMYYPYGWKATIDGKNADIGRANYVLRSLVIPKGKHKIRFVFEPGVVQKGGKYSLIAYITFLLLAGLGYFVVSRYKE